MVEAHELRRQFGAVSAVAGLDLSVAPGEIFGLVGPDGAGKTTTIRMLCSVLAPTAGEARVAGFDVLRQPEQVKRRIGYMPQRFSLYGDLTVAENLAFFARIYHVPKAERIAREQRLLEFSRLGPFRDRQAQHLSGGMKQKLALSCALLHTPTVLFLDEPTTGVDPVSRRDFWRILYALLRDGVTIFISTPYMDEAERCGRVALMAAGRVLTCDTPEGLKGRMEGDLLEVIAAPQREAQAVLAAAPEARGVQVFGDRLHVWVGEAERDAPRLSQTLSSRGLRVESLRPIAPSLEDVFVSLVTGESR